MKPIVPLLIVALACALAWPALAPAQQRPQPAPQMLPPSVVGGALPAAAWAASTSLGQRVLVAAPPSAPAMRIGPDGPGHDGPPAMAAFGSHGLMIVAARTDGSRARLWSQIADGTAWQEPIWLTDAPGMPDNPALAARGENAWVVWPADDVSGTRLLAAEWKRGAWSPAETVPSVRGTPGLPALALDADGQPLVIWPESDGHDEEIWMSRRGRNGWSLPRALSHNDVPDILPSVAADGEQIVAAWSRLEPGGDYAAVAARGRSRSWGRPQRLSATAAGGISVATANPPTVIWSELSGSGDHRTVTGVELVQGRWHSLGALGTAVNARHDADRANGQLTLAWHQESDVAVATATQERNWRTTLWRGASRLPEPPRRVVLLNTYLGFGDSITEGLMRYDGVISYAEPYTTFLQTWTTSYLRQTTVVRNAGLGGEFTAEGVSRIKANLSGQRAALILEGANDMANRFDPYTTAANLRLMVQSARAAGSIPAIASVMPFRTAGFNDHRNVAINELNLLLLNMAKAEGAIFVDQYAAFHGKSNFYSDHLHPNDVGYQEMARVWFRGVKPMLDQWLMEGDVEYDRDRDRQLDRSRPPVARRR